MAFARRLSAGDICKEALLVQGLPVPPSISSNTNDATSRQIWGLLRLAGRRLCKPTNTHRWQVLTRLWELDTIPGQTLYDLPEDHDSFEDLTGWNYSSRLPMLGPATDPQWQTLKARNLGSSTISVVYRNSGGKFEIYNSFDDPQQLRINYTSRAWVELSAGGFADAPTEDGDIVLFDPELMVTALQLAFMTAKGFDTNSVFSVYQKMLEAAIDADTDAPVLQTVISDTYPLLTTQFNVPDTGYGVYAMLAPQGLLHALQTAMPPVHGLNTTGAIAAMPETDAIEMDNFISTDLGVAVREGWREYGTNLNGAVRTIMSYEGAPMLSTTSPLALSQLFCATDTGIFDIEGGGNFTGAVAEIALSGATYAGRMSCVQFTTDAGQYLIACSEVDGGFLYNGVSWMKMTSAGGPGPGIITGINPALFVQVCAYKKRLIFTERGRARVWILDVGVVGGAAVPFDFGPLMRHGGMVLGLANWTQDDGEGTDDRLCIIGSSGDLVIYEGDDPTSAEGISNIGVWYIGQPPVGRRCFTESGGNVFILTVFGVIPVTQIVQGGIDSLLTSGTDYFQQLRKMQDVLNRDFSVTANVVGWELLHIATKALLFVARPVTVSSEHIQYAFQEHNLAWSRLLDIPGNTFARRLSEVYAGTVDGRVLRVLDGPTDGMLLNGTGSHEIRARLTPAFSYFGTPTQVKQALMCRVNFLSNTDPGYVVTMNTDFALRPPGTAPTPGTFVGALWDASFWDASFWVGSRGAFGEWRSVEGLGYALAPSIYVASQQPTTIANIEYMVKQGGPL